MAINDILRFVVRQQLHGQAIYNVFHYIVDVSGAQDDTAVSVGIFENEIVPAMRAVQSNELVHLDVVGQKIWPQPPRVPVVVFGNAGAGQVAQNSLPTSVSVTITKRTEFAGPRYRGRSFIAGIPVTHEDNSALAAANVAAWQNVADEMAATIVGATRTISPVLWRRSNNSFQRITACQVRTILRNQRRRQLGKGI